MADPPASDPLARFLAAQDAIWPRPLDELRAGAKRSHWMWFVFPQIAGLGSSVTARRYAIADLAEARAYLAHPLLGPRLLDATAAVTAARPGASADAILGGIDATKLRSSLTLFAAAAGPGADAPFVAALARFFAGQRDPETLRRL